MNRGRVFYRNVIALALPILLQNLCTTLLGLVDTFMVGSLGEAPLAAVSQANLPVFVIQLVIFGLQSGSSVLISQFWGKKDTDTINRVMGIGCYVAGAIAALFAIVMCFFPTQLMGLLTDNEELIPLAASYARIVGPSYLFNSLTGVYVGAHRSMENPKLGMIVFATSMATNTFLNWVFIFGNLGAPALGVEGAAFATLLSRILEFGITMTYALTNKRFKLKPTLMFRPGRPLIQKFFRYSCGAWAPPCTRWSWAIWKTPPRSWQPGLWQAIWRICVPWPSSPWAAPPPSLSAVRSAPGAGNTSMRSGPL